MKIISAFIFLLNVLINISSAFAHEQSVARIKIIDSEIHQIENYSYQLIWQVSLKDLVRVEDLDIDQNGKIEWGEITTNELTLEKIVSSNISLKSIHNRCSMVFNDVSTSMLFNGYALNINMNISCLNELNHVQYSFLKGLDSLHVAEIDINITDVKIKQLLTRSNFEVNLLTNNESPTEQTGFVGFIYQGIVHILIGIDHLLFLLILIFSSLVVNTGNRDKLFNRKSFKNIAMYVTAFTLAHTITLISASLNWLLLPSWIVESIIAASIALGAFKLLFTKNVINTVTVFNFGLIHGLGFASVLSDLTGGISENILLLLGFNLGVEIGQILFLILIVSILFIGLRKMSFSSLKIIIAIPVFVVSIAWTLERLFELEIVPF